MRSLPHLAATGRRSSARCASLALLASVLACAVARAQATPSAPEATAKPESPVTPEAQALLTKFGDAVAKLEAFRSAGTITTEMALGGSSKKTSRGFISEYRSPTMFRHEVPKELVLGGTGEKLYGYRPDKRVYLQEKSADAYPRGTDLPAFAFEILSEQDPVLLARLTASPGQELMRGATSVDVDGASAIKGKFPSGETRRVEFDTTTGLPVRVTIDFAQVLKDKGTPDVDTAKTTIEYARIDAIAPGGAETFAWVPPEDASDAGKAPAGAAVETSALVGKPAPDFTLKDLDGKDVHLAELKGHVVVLDFWATWCPPCRAGLPYIDKLHAEFSPRGAKVFGVNEQESAPEVNKFREQTKLSLPVLFDGDGKVGGLYGVTGIPTTVVIGADGIVRKVTVGFDESEVEVLKKEVASALAGK